MGACTSSVRHRKKHHRQLHKRTLAKNSPVLDNKQVSFSPLSILSKQQSQRPQSLFTNLDIQSSHFLEPIVYKTDTNSLIQLYSSNSNNNNNSKRNSWMSSSSSSTSHPQPRIPVPKTRLPVYQPSSTTASLRPKNVTTTGTTRPMSISNRSSLPSPSQPTAQPRLGFIPRPTASGLQQAQAAILQARSRSISPSSTNSANSTPKPHITKTQTSSSRLHTTIASKSKVAPSSSPRVYKDAPSSTTTATADRQRINTSSRPSNSSSSIPSALPSKIDVNATRDRYKAPKRMNFFTRRIPITNAIKSSPIEPTVIEEEKNENSSADEHTASFPIESQNDDITTDSVHQGDSAYASTESPTNRPTSAQRSHTTRYRHRTPSTLSSSSALSNVLNQEGLLDDDNCSLKSEDLICDYDDTLTLDSISKTNRTDSCSSNSLSLEMNKKSPSITKVNATPMQSNSKDPRSPNNVRESLDELTRLSYRMDNVFDYDHHRLTRSISLKPPSTALPPREDAEQITMDIESYRQVMKDVMVVKTILHQLDRLLKHSDGANMTDSMIGSFHDSMISSRHQSMSGMGGESSNIRTNSIDENSSYEDLAKELILLRKEREQDKQTIKLLQEQMYKYSSQTNGS
ncbi:hypothetical protein I4U23_014201 [Adineta vaga]|nr:hypothetical protein I4U23_014201 [Adineta vaga]